MSPFSKTQGWQHRIGLIMGMVFIVGAIWWIATSTAAMAGPVGTRAFSAVPTSCVQLVVNPSFETSEAWTITDTTYWAAYSTDYAHTGLRSMRTGIPPDTVNVRSYSSVRQLIIIPADAVSATLHLWYLPFSQEGDLVPDSEPHPLRDHRPDSQPLASDRQYVLILDEQDNILDWLMWGRSDAGQWTEAEYDVSLYIGQAIAPHMGTFNDGRDGVTTMYVDDVTLEVCYPPEVHRHWLPLVTVQ